MVRVFNFGIRILSVRKIKNFYFFVILSDSEGSSKRDEYTADLSTVEDSSLRSRMTKVDFCDLSNTRKFGCSISDLKGCRLNFRSLHPNSGASRTPENRQLRQI